MQCPYPSKPRFPKKVRKQKYDSSSEEEDEVQYYQPSGLMCPSHPSMMQNPYIMSPCNSDPFFPPIPPHAFPHAPHAPHAFPHPPHSLPHAPPFSCQNIRPSPSISTHSSASVSLPLPASPLSCHSASLSAPASPLSCHSAPRKRRNAIISIEDDPFAPPSEEKELMAEYLRQYRKEIKDEEKEQDKMSCHSLPLSYQEDNDSISSKSSCSTSSSSSSSEVSEVSAPVTKKTFIIRIPKRRLPCLQK